MGDNTLWVAVLTGATAILASWVTSRGQTRAARMQAEFTAAAQRRDRLREVRRIAYLDLIQHLQSLRPIRFRIKESNEVTDPDQRIAGLREQLVAMRHGQDQFLNLLRVIAVEGPSPVIACAESLGESISSARKDIEALIDGHTEAIDRFELHFSEGSENLQRFIEAVRAALDAM
jgi:hypothetical protein